MDESDKRVTVEKKVKKPGVIYLNYIPRYMTVTKVRDLLSEFGEVRRLFLKPDKGKKRGKPSKFFTEGWIEFGKKKIAKKVAEHLNGTQVGGKKHTPYFDALWSIKYLRNFQWSQLHEGQAYNKARKEQHLRAEIAQVKREVNFYNQGVEKTKCLKRMKGEVGNRDSVEEKKLEPLSLPTIEKKCVKDTSTDDRSKLLLRKVFGNG